MMITLQQIILRRSQKLLLDNINLTIYARQKMGLIGDNGCGKSSFFALLKGDLEPHQGSLLLPNNLEIAEVRQEIPTSNRPAIEYVIDGDQQYRIIENKLQEAEQDGNPDLLAKCHDELAHIDGYAMTGKAEKILRGLGFKGDQLHNPTTSFSGGWRMRLNLAQALMSRAELMLLDEPTNHLDLDAIIWLEKWLQDYAGTLLVISHDREFLDNTVNHILHFENQQVHLYKGDFSSFEKQRAEQLAVQQATYEKQRHQIAHMQSFVDRFRAKASKAKQAQSRLKALQKIEIVAAVQTPDSFQFSFKKPKECPNPILRIERVELGYEAEKPILINIDLTIAPSDRIGLLGVNGAGKSTFIKLLAGKLQPSKGLVHFYKGTKIGYFAQHQIEHLDMQSSPLQMLRELAPTQSEQELRNFLGSFNFGGEMATSSIIHFSGGEKARLALALIVWQAPNLLLLDEPTNHLDMRMREALILALQDYSGALILVSHDRYLVRTTTDELMIVKDKNIERFKGDLDDYKEHLLQKPSTKEASLEKQKKYNKGKEKRKLETQLNTIEKKLSELQKEKINIETRLADRSLHERTPDTIRTYRQQQKEIIEKIKQVEFDWLSIFEQLEAFKD